MSIDARFQPAHFTDSVMTLRFEGAHDIFRFAINMLGAQVEFGQAGRAMLVELREHMTPERFDPMARSLLGEDRYTKLAHRFERDQFCAACESDLALVGRRARIADAKALCPECADGHYELFEVTA